MNLLYVHESIGSLGGAEANVFITATEMKRRGHRVGLLTQRPTGKNEAAWHGLFGADVFWDEKDEWPDVLARFDPAVVYMHKWENLGAIEAMLASGRPLIRMVHDHDIYCLRSYKYHPLSRRICTRPAGLYCVIPCLAPLKRNRGPGLPFKWVSYFAKLREIGLVRRFQRHLVVTTYMRHELEINGFDPARIEIFPPVPRPVPPLTPSFSDRNLLIYAGQIIRGKGVDVLLRAMARVRTKFELIILGDGSHKPACERLARELGLTDRVTFKGFVPQVELQDYYRDASGVLISSLWPEPIATIGLEVMRFALPVVAFDAGGIKDWLKDGETGYLVPWMNIDAYARRVEDLLADKARARAMGETGRKFVSEHYDFDRYIADLEALFARVSADKASAARP
jgi:glycosyltransferase involved in cell wall biosynthesis